SYPYLGQKLVRQMQRDGAFAQVPADQVHDLNLFLGAMGRGAAVKQLLCGQRFRGIELYLLELAYQLRLKRFDFLLAFPAFAFLPRRVVQRWAYKNMDADAARERIELVDH
ncbi:MAG TPA: hypothetical protein VL282_06940, partial [Tepidisphaeraceae bacterium]|nr:hypothetical protein [Tepidisphaeraceae bacterium]